MIIHVPQGYSARLAQESQEYYSTGMYTDRFSSCNIVVCYDEQSQKMVLMHVDTEVINSQAQTAKILEQIKWVGSNCKVKIFYRTKESAKHDAGCDGEFIHARLIELLAPTQISLESTVVQEEEYGILVFFDDNADNKFAHKILKKDDSLGELAHHPQEQKLLNVRKIHQLIGMRAKAVAASQGAYNDPSTTFSLFDGCMWLPLANHELQVDTSHPITAAEMNSFGREYSWIMVAREAAGISSMLREHMPVLKADFEMGCEVSGDLEWYFTQDPELLLRRNLLDVLNDSGYAVPVSSADKNFFQKCTDALKKHPLPLDEIKTLLDEYCDEKSQSTQFKEIIIADFPAQLKRYYDRKYYVDMHQRYDHTISQAKLQALVGIKAYRSKNYQEAATHFFAAIKMLALCTLKSNPDLAAAYFNYGRSLQQLGEYQRAAIFLEQSMQLREHFTCPKPSAEQIAKTRAALQECQSSLKSLHAGSDAVPSLAM